MQQLSPSQQNMWFLDNNVMNNLTVKISTWSISQEMFQKPIFEEFHVHPVFWKK